MLKDFYTEEKRRDCAALGIKAEGPKVYPDPKPPAATTNQHSKCPQSATKHYIQIVPMLPTLFHPTHPTPIPMVPLL